MTGVSVIATVRNERESIAELLQSLQRQTRRPMEIVVVDGGSSDGTAEYLELAAREDPALRVYRAPGASISQGRNVAVQRAAGQIIAVTDAGTIVASDWLERLVRPLEVDTQVAVSAGFFLPGGNSFFERCLSAVITPQLPEIDERTFLPSSRSIAFRKEWWERVGGYPEWLRHCEDLVFDLELKRAGARIAFVPEAVVHWRARPTLRHYSRQYFDYARGDGHALLWPARHAARYGAYLLGAGLLVTGWWVPGCWIVLGAGMVAHLWKFFRRVIRLPPATGFAGTAVAWCLVPVIVVAGDIAKMLGYPVGRLERHRAGGPSGLLDRLKGVA